jgi:hypothetical protein
MIRTTAAIEQELTRYSQALVASDLIRVLSIPVIRLQEIMLTVLLRGMSQLHQRTPPPKSIPPPGICAV